MFSTPSYNTIGDEYDKKVAVPDRCRGSQFKTTPGKKGGAGDVLFDKKFKSISEGDKYIDPGTVEKKDRLEQSKRKLTTEGFRYTSPGKRSTGLGNNFGCFSQWKHETEYVVLKKGERPDQAPAQPKNIVTNPSRKGTFGVPGVTLSKGDEYRYLSDPYDSEKMRQADESKDNQKRQIGPPFRVACKRMDFFDSQPNVAASRIFSLDKALPARRPEPPRREPVIATPFKPSSPSKRGFNCTLSKAPEYKEDPYEMKERLEREERKKNKPAVVWKPVSAAKSLPSRSIAFNKTAA